MKFDYLTPFLNHKFIDFQILFKKSGYLPATSVPNNHTAVAYIRLLL